MKKFIAILIILIFNTGVYALEPSDISAECAILVEGKTQSVLFAKNENTKHAMASTTKIMTAILALEEASPSDIVQISANAAATEGSSVYVAAGERIYMEDLVYGLMLNSGNDAAVAIAEHICGNVPDFCEKMNKKAKEIGALDTSFKNPNGLFEEGHFTTAQDLAKITCYAMQNEKFRQIVSTKTKAVTLVDSANEVYFSNHNKLLWNYDGAIGVKTGYTKDTGRCLVSAAEKNGSTVIAVTLDAPNDWQDHTKLLDYGFSRVESKIIIEKNQVLKTAEINGKIYDFVAEKDSVISVIDKKGVDTVVNIKIADKLTGPFEKGEKVGVAEIIYDGNILDTVNIVSEEAVFTKSENENILPQKNGFFKKLINLVIKFFLYV